MPNVEVLLVEDNPGDVLLTRKALGNIRRVRLSVVGDGAEALDYLRGVGDHVGATRPHIILLDLNLPKVSGQELLAEMKADESLRRIPVVVLTSSQAESDVVQSFDLQCQSYMVKPVNRQSFVSFAETLEEWWLVLGRVPRA